MNDPPIHPATGKPVTPQELITESDALDRELASGDYSGLVLQVAGLRKLNARLTGLVKWLIVVFVLFAVTAVFSLYWAFRVDHNTRELNRTQSALLVFCDQTNRYNAEAREKLNGLFPTADPAMIANIGNVMWPTRDCAAVSSSSPTTSPDGTPPSTTTPLPP